MHWFFEGSSLVSGWLHHKWTPGISLRWTAPISCSTSRPGQSPSTSYWPTTSSSTYCLGQSLFIFWWPSISCSTSCLEFCCFQLITSFCLLSSVPWTPSCSGQWTGTWSSPWSGWEQTTLASLDPLDHLCITNILLLLQIQTRLAF